MNDLMIAGDAGKALVAIQQQAAVLDVAAGIASSIAKAGMLPASYKGNVAAGAVAIMFGATLGFNALQSLQSIAVVNGMPTVWGDGVLALIHASGLLESMSLTYEGDGDGFSAVVTMTRRGMTPHVERFSVAMAKKAGKWGQSGPWSQYPALMLRRRAIGNCAKMLFADVLRGLNVDDDAPAIDGGVIQSAPIPPRPSAARNVIPDFDQAEAENEPEADQVEVTEEPPAITEDEVSTLALHLVEKLNSAASKDDLRSIAASRGWAEMKGYAEDFPKKWEGVMDCLIAAKERLGVA